MAFAVYSEFQLESKEQVASLCAAVGLGVDEQVMTGHGNLITWHLHQPDPARPTLVHLLEVYATAGAYNEARKKDKVLKALNASGLSTNEDNPARRTLVLGNDTSGAQSKFRMLPRPMFSQLDAGFVIHSAPNFQLPSTTDDEFDDAEGPVLLEFSLVPSDEGGDALEQHVKTLIADLAKDGDKGCVSAMVIDGGFSLVPLPATNKVADSFAMILCLVFASGKQAAQFSAAAPLAELVKCCGDAPLIVASGEKRNKYLPLALEQAQKLGFRVHDTLSLAGYVVHPGLGAGHIEAELPLSSGPVKVGGKKLPFSMKFDGKREPRVLTVNNAASVSAPDEDTLVIPLPELLKKMLGRAAASGDGIEARLVFSRLGRLRGLSQCFQTTNAYNARQAAGDKTETSDREAHEIEMCIENLNALGYVLPSKHAQIKAEFLDDLVECLEDAFHVSAMRESIAAYSTIEYGQLLEYYRVGDIVKSSVATLGSSQVLYRVCDAYYESVRSIMGQRKLSFHIGLEYIATLGDNFAYVSFDQIIGDWEGAQQLDHLPYARVDVDGQEFDRMTKRGQRVLDLGLTPTYRTYRGPCFFAHGVVSRGTNLSEDGRMMVDTVRGMTMGHSVARGNDEVCMAYQLVVKAYREVQRARADGKKSDKLGEQLKRSGLRLMSTVPAGLCYLIWPAVVGFSLNLKKWGHVLVDGLEQVKPNPVPWEKLVLPQAKKELLLSLVEANFDVNAPKLRDIVSGKGSGSLFLLHGVPGTGKTLTVMALAERFSVPAYYLTFGELGTSVKELEATMTDVLGMCSAWGALVLLDEGDALVERREKGALLLNSMVGVLLKALDSFEGLLFITSNRVAAFDPAALSRVTLAIRYGSLKNSGRMKVWNNVLIAAGADPASGKFDLNALAKRGGSGRDINSAARLALNLAYHRKAPITQELLIEVLDVAADFKKDFGEGLEAHKDGGRISDDEED